jgi:hypothetical protein
MENKKEKFKQKGHSILSGPNSMKDFLEGQKNTQMHKDAITQLHKATDTQKHKNTLAQKRNYTNTQSPKESNRETGPERLERIHVQIRKDLADKLFAKIYARKREGRSKRNASQRHIIEQALEEYFAK